MFVVKQVPVCNFSLLIFACVILRKGARAFIVYVGNSGIFRLLFLDSDKRLNQ